MPQARQYGMEPPRHSHAWNCLTVMHEVVALQDLWLCHAFFGAPSPLNDINALNILLIFKDIYKGTTPDPSFVVHRASNIYEYYLMDVIYPKLSIFVKILSYTDEKNKLELKRTQEKERKYLNGCLKLLKMLAHTVVPTFF